MKRKISSLLLVILSTLSIYAMIPFTEMDVYTDEQREEIISKKILRCKDVVDVKVKEHGSEESSADIEITLTGGRSLILASYGIRLKIENLCIMQIGNIVPVELKYKSYYYAGNRQISIAFYKLNASKIKLLDKRLVSIRNISTLIKNYDIIYSIYSNLPEADETFPKISYIDMNCRNEIRCDLWENLENPYFYKTETEGGKFYKMTKEAYIKYKGKKFLYDE